MNAHTHAVEQAPIFIMSSERSGSNVLRVLLGSHSSIAAPIPLHFLISFKTLVHRYGPLAERKNARRLFNHCIALANHSYHAWNLQIDFDYACHTYTLNTWIDFFHLLYSEYAAREQKRRFACKENNIFDFVQELAGYYKSPKFIYLYRDPRDYALSWMKLPVGPKTSYLAANKWLEEQRRCSLVISSYRLDVFPLQYEELITNTREKMTQLLAFLDEPAEESCFGMVEGNNADVAWNVYWENLNKPILPGNCNKYFDLLSKKTVSMIETVTRKYLVALGYRCTTEANWKQPPFFKLQETMRCLLGDWRRRCGGSETARRIASRKALLSSIARGERITN